MELQQILAAAKQVAENTHCIFEYKDYSQYGWMGIALKTDNFGGCAVNLCYRLEDKRCFDWIHDKNEKEIVSIKRFIRYATSKVNNMRKKRDTQDLYDFINAEYY